MDTPILWTHPPVETFCLSLIFGTIIIPGYPGALAMSRYTPFKEIIEIDARNMLEAKLQARAVIETTLGPRAPTTGRISRERMMGQLSE